MEMASEVINVNASCPGCGRKHRLNLETGVRDSFLIFMVWYVFFIWRSTFQSYQNKENSSVLITTPELHFHSFFSYLSLSYPANCLWSKNNSVISFYISLSHPGSPWLSRVCSVSSQWLFSHPCVDWLMAEL